MSTPSEDDEAVVLIVDDEPEVLETFKLYLDRRYDVRTASGGGEALLEISPEVDVMILDRRMPDMSGDEVIERVEELPVECNIIMATAVDPDFDILDMSFVDYLNKPISKDKLRETVRTVLLKDRYDELTSEYRVVSRKYSVLQETLDDDELKDNEDFDELSNRRSEIRSELKEIIAELPDKDFSNILTGSFDDQ